MSNKKNQISDPNLKSFLKKQSEETVFDLPEDEAPDAIRKGTNPLLWNAPVYRVVGDLSIKKNSENPNEYWKKWADEQELKYK